MAAIDYLVESPDLNQRFLIGSNTPKVDAFCPIDRTQLVWFNEYDFSNYSCMACKATYSDRNPSKEELKAQASAYVKELKQRAEQKKQELSEIEKILKVAEKNNIS